MVNVEEMPWKIDTYYGVEIESCKRISAYLRNIFAVQVRLSVIYHYHILSKKKYITLILCNILDSCECKHLVN